MTTASNDPAPKLLQGRRIALVGKLAGMSKREAGQLLRDHGAVLAHKPDAAVHLIVLGEAESPLAAGIDPEELFDDQTRQSAEQGSLEVITETQLWERLGLLDLRQDIHRLYTPAMLAELLRVPVAVIRRWHRRGLIVPVREVRRLPYFDFQEVATARRLAQLLAAGMKPQAVEKKLEALARYVPGVARPLAQLSVIIEGRQILLRQGDGLIEPGGQLRLDFEAVASPKTAKPAERDAAGMFLSLAGQRAGLARLGPTNWRKWPPNWKRKGNWSRPPRRTAQPWPQAARPLRSVSNWRSCCTALGIGRRRGSGISRRSSWTRITSRRE